MTKPATKPAKLSLMRAGSWTLVGYGVYLLTQLGVLSALAQLTRPEDVGLFALALAVCTPVLMLTNLGMRVAIATDAHDAYTISDYFALRSVSTALAVVALGILGAVFFDGFTALWLFGVVAAGKLVETYSDVYYGHFQKCERVDLVARSLLLRGAASFAVFLGVLYITRVPGYAFLAQLIVWSLVLFLHDRRASLRLQTDTATGWPPRAVLVQLFKLVWPLGVGALAVALASTVPRLMIEQYQGLAALGYFAAITYILYAGVFFANAMGAIIAPRLSRAWADGRTTAFHRTLAKAMVAAFGLGCVLTAGGWVLGAWVLTLAFGADYAAYWVGFTVVLAALGLRICAVVVQTGLTAQRRFKRVGAIQFVGLVLTAGFCWLGIVNLGLMGGFYGLFAANLAQLGLLAVLFVSKKSV